MIRLVNLTEHPVRLVSEEAENGGVLFIAPSGDVARIDVTATPQPALNIQTEGGVIAAPVVLREFGAVTGLPEPTADTFFIVSSMVLAACPERTDLLAPDTGPDSVIRKDGQIIGVKRFTRDAGSNPILKAMESMRQASLSGMVEMALTNAKSDLDKLLTRNGAVVQSEVFYRTCHGGRTCACNSHPEGFYEMQVAVPFAWTLGCDEYSPDYIKPVNFFKDVEERDQLLFIVPDKETGPRAVVKRHYEHPWYPETKPLYQQHRFAPGYFSSWNAKYHN